MISIPEFDPMVKSRERFSGLRFLKSPRPFQNLHFKAGSPLLRNTTTMPRLGYGTPLKIPAGKCIVDL
jgi:hypothetical protein